MKKTWNHVLIACLSLPLVYACGSSDSSSNNSATTVTLSGTVYAPGTGALAFNKPTVLQRLLAALLGESAHAVSGQFASVGAGVTVRLNEVDASGNLVPIGSELATTITAADGSFILEAPAGFTPAPQYVIRASGTSETLESRVVATSVVVDPTTDAASRLITDLATDLTTLSTTEIGQINDEINDLLADIDTSTALTATDWSSVLKVEAVDDVATHNVISSKLYGGQICGHVQDSAGTALANISIIAADYGDFVFRAKTKTDSSGNYCINVPVAGDANPDISGTFFSGDYILGALNYTSTSMGASEWWSTGGTSYLWIDADKIAVADATIITKNFALEPGARISGAVTAAVSGASLAGIKVNVRDFRTNFPTGTVRTNETGGYRINVIPDTYTVSVRNTSEQHAYASEFYDGAAGTDRLTKALPLTLAAGDNPSINFALDIGYKVFGSVSVPTPTTTPIAGTLVRVDTEDGAPAYRLRTNKQGNYRIWLPAATYAINAYGQINSALVVSNANVEYNFSDPVARLNAIIVDSVGDPVNQAKVYLRDAATGDFRHMEVSHSDGSVSVYSNTTGDHVLEVRIDDARSYGSIIYDDVTTIAGGMPVNMTVGQTAPLSSNIVLPPGGVLNMLVTDTGDASGAPVADLKVSVRSGGLTQTSNFTFARTRADGSALLSLPLGTYDRVRFATADGLTFVNADNVTVNSGENSLNVTWP